MWNFYNEHIQKTFIYSVKNITGKTIYETQFLYTREINPRRLNDACIKAEKNYSIKTFKNNYITKENSQVKQQTQTPLRSSTTRRKP